MTPQTVFAGLFLLCLSAWPAPAQAQTPPRLVLIPIDTLLYVENRGATRILVNLNGRSFKLVADPAEIAQSRNAFPIPRAGTITVDIAAFMHSGDDNYIELLSQGPTGSEAEIVVSPVPISGQEVAYAITDLQELPTERDLLASYPNPFRGQTTITYEIPEARTNGLDVFLAVYDVLGRRVRVLVDDRRYPGRFPLTWDGTGAGGETLASGVYFCRLTAGEWHQTIKMVLVR